MEVIDAEGRSSGELKPPPHLPMPSGDLRRAELNFPFDLAWLPSSGHAFRLDALHRILPIPEQEYPLCGDWYLIHLMTLLGTVSSLPDVGAYYRVHGANNYEPQEQRLNLDHVRETIRYDQITTRALERLADTLGQKRPSRILSVSDVGNRLLSLKLEPKLHPLSADSTGMLVVDGARAALRRFDVSWPMKLIFVAWFAATALSPRPRPVGSVSCSCFLEDARLPTAYWLAFIRRGPPEGRPT